MIAITGPPAAGKSTVAEQSRWALKHGPSTKPTCLTWKLYLRLFLVGIRSMSPLTVRLNQHGSWAKSSSYTRTGQLELSCASCHEDNYGNYIRADHLSQGQINGFPTYRLKNAKLNGVHSRFRGCVRDTRAETYAVGSDEFVALELYLASRGNGLSVEGPSVRN